MDGREDAATDRAADMLVKWRDFKFAERWSSLSERLVLQFRRQKADVKFTPLPTPAVSAAGIERQTFPRRGEEGQQSGISEPRREPRSGVGMSHTYEKSVEQKQAVSTAASTVPAIRPMTP